MLRLLKTYAFAIYTALKVHKRYDDFLTAHQPVGCMHLFQICCRRKASSSLFARHSNSRSQLSYPLNCPSLIDQEWRTALRHSALLLLSVSGSCAMYTQQRRVFCARASSRTAQLAIIQYDQHLPVGCGTQRWVPLHVLHCGLYGCPC